MRRQVQLEFVTSDLRIEPFRSFVPVGTSKQTLKRRQTPTSYAQCTIKSCTFRSAASGLQMPAVQEILRSLRGLQERPESLIIYGGTPGEAQDTCKAVLCFINPDMELEQMAWPANTSPASGQLVDERTCTSIQDISQSEIKNRKATRK